MPVKTLSFQFYRLMTTCGDVTAMDPCSRCQKVDDKTALKTLSCGHGFCVKCLFQVAKEQYGFMPCPSCRQDTLYSLVASTRHHQLSGALCKYHVQPLEIYCHVCNVMICRVCTMLEHRQVHGHVLSKKKNDIDDHFLDLFNALDQVQKAQKRLEDTSNNILRSLTRKTDVVKREINETSDRILDKHYELFRDYLSSESAKIDDICVKVKDVKMKASTGVIEAKSAVSHLRSAIEKESSAVEFPLSNCKKYIERPFNSLKCEVPKTRLSVTLSSPPRHFKDWLGDTVGILWALPKQLIMVVDERIEGGEDLRIYSFHAQDLNTVKWTHREKLSGLRTRAVLCQESYRRLNELWFWVAAGDKLYHFTLDLQRNDSPIERISCYGLTIPSNALGVTAIACITNDDYCENKFLVITRSNQASSLLTLYSWNGTHEEDVALGRLSDYITDMTIQPSEKSLVICDAGSSMVRSFNQDTLSSSDQYNYTLKAANSDPAIPISVTCNRYGDVFILWLSSEVRKEDIVFAVWNVTVWEREALRMFVAAVGSSLETGIPTGIGCWDNDLAICFKDGRIRLLRNYSSLNAKSEMAGEAEATLSVPRKRSRTGRVSNLQHSTSLLSVKSGKPHSTRRRFDTTV